MKVLYDNMFKSTVFQATLYPSKTWTSSKKKE